MALRNINAEESFSTLPQLRTLGHEAKPIEVHIRTANDDHKFLLCADEVLLDYVSL